MPLTTTVDDVLNLDFERPLVIETEPMAWIASPAEQVWRKPLERAAAESGLATSIVRFGAGASFPSHPHPLGEEIYVLEGIFSDQQGDYPAGSYLRNPPGSSHAPYTHEGCTLFVKLDQFDPRDSERVVATEAQRQWLPGQGNLRVCPLHEFEGQHTALVHWPANEVFQPHRHWGGEEILVLSGTFIDEQGRYPRGTWMRSPHLSRHHPFVEEETLILVKTGHLPQTP